MQRPLLKQDFTTFALSVGVNGTPINSQMQLTAMVDTIAICVPSTAANSVFFGADQGVTTASGLELLPSTTSAFRIAQMRQLYELQYPLQDLKNAAMCKVSIGEEIPVIVWDVSQIYLVAAGVTTVSIAVFKAVYV